ncbi:Uncharacterised protein [Klebsiella variicola]|nr:Uncharacterised protein [Klebsiella variicola]
MSRLIQPLAGPGVVAAIVLCQKCTNYSMFPATSNNGSQRLIQSGHAWCLPWPFSVSHLNERRHNQLRITTTARCDDCAWLVGTVPYAGTELPGDNWSDYTGARLFQDGVCRFIKRARFSLVFASTVTSEEWDKARLNNPQRMTIPSWSSGRACDYRWYRFGDWLPGGAGAKLGQVWYRDRKTMGFRNRLQRPSHRLPAKKIVLPFRRCVVALDDERLGTVDNEALDSPGNAPERVFRQRLFAAKNRRGWDGPVDAFCSCAPWCQFAS